MPHLFPSPQERTLMVLLFVIQYIMHILTVDALFAVYEASSLELWFFMYQSSTNGSARSIGNIVLFYFTLVSFLVFFVQVHVYRIKSYPN